MKRSQRIGGTVSLVLCLCIGVACSDSSGTNGNNGDAAADGARTGGMSGNLGGTGGGAAPGGGGSSGGQGGARAGDAPVTQDTRVELDLGDAAPQACPADVTTATCTPDSYCLKADGKSGCGCLNTGRWFCPPIIIGADGGIVVPDGGIGDAGVPACPTGTATGVACTMKATLCSGVGMLGCACTEVAGGLRWLCY
jgi:hypothetical protein